MKSFVILKMVLLIVFIFTGCNKKELEDEAILTNYVKWIEQRYGATVQFNPDGGFVANYNDGLKLVVVSDNNGGFIMKGSKLSGGVFSVVKEINRKNDLPFEIKELEEIKWTAKRPCSQHPESERFSECFKREVEEFCDDVPGCSALILWPKAISLMIAAHCLICGEINN